MSADDCCKSADGDVIKVVLIAEKMVRRQPPRDASNIAGLYCTRKAWLCTFWGTLYCQGVPPPYRDLGPASTSATSPLVWFPVIQSSLSFHPAISSEKMQPEILVRLPICHFIVCFVTAVSKHTHTHPPPSLAHKF